MRILPLFLSLACVACAAGPLDRILDPLPKDARPSTPSLLSQLQPMAPARPAFSLTTDALVAELEKQAAKHFAADGELKLSLARTWPALRLPEADWVLTIAEWPVGGLSGTLVVRIKVVSGSETIVEGQPCRARSSGRMFGFPRTSSNAVRRSTARRSPARKRMCCASASRWFSQAWNRPRWNSARLSAPAARSRGGTSPCAR